MAGNKYERKSSGQYYAKKTKHTSDKIDYFQKLQEHIENAGLFQSAGSLFTTLALNYLIPGGGFIAQGVKQAGGDVLGKSIGNLFAGDMPKDPRFRQDLQSTYESSLDPLSTESLIGSSIKGVGKGMTSKYMSELTGEAPGPLELKKVSNIKEDLMSIFGKGGNIDVDRLPLTTDTAMNVADRISGANENIKFSGMLPVRGNESTKDLIKFKKDIY